MGPKNNHKTKKDKINMAQRQKLRGVKVMLPKFRANWVYVIDPRAPQEDGKKPQFSITALFAKDADLTEVKKACLKAAVEAWGSDKAKWPKNRVLPFKDQGAAAKEGADGKEVLPEGYVAGATYLEAKTYDRPGLVDRDGVTPITDSSEFYSGCYARAVVTFKAYEYLGKKGVTCYLQHVQKIKDGPSLGGRTRPEEEFSAIEDDDTFEGADTAEDVDLDNL